MAVEAVECVVTFSDGKQLTRTARVSGDDRDALESLSTALCTLRDQVNADISEVVEHERASGKSQKRPSSQLMGSSDGELFALIAQLTQFINRTFHKIHLFLLLQDDDDSDDDSPSGAKHLKS